MLCILNNVIENIFYRLILMSFEPPALDRQMIAYLHHYNIPFTLIATKGDKLSRAQIQKQKSVIAKTFALTPSNIYVTSALNKSGVGEILDRIQKQSCTPRSGTCFC